MNFSDFWDKHGITVQQYTLPIVLGGVGFVLILYGLISFVLPKESSNVVFEAGSEKASAAESADTKDKEIVVDIAGAVLRPGVYKLPKDARIQDALIAAGGMGGNADREKVAKGMNLAAKLVDGGKIYIPFTGDATAVAQGGSAGQAVMGDSASALININSASTSELDSLPGVGLATAEKIITNRPYEKIEDLLSKKAVGQSVFGKIKDKISVY